MKSSFRPKYQRKFFKDFSPTSLYRQGKYLYCPESYITSEAKTEAMVKLLQGRRKLPKLGGLVVVRQAVAAAAALLCMYSA